MDLFAIVRNIVLLSLLLLVLMYPGPVLPHSVGRVFAGRVADKQMNKEAYIKEVAHRLHMRFAQIKVVHHSFCKFLVA